MQPDGPIVPEKIMVRADDALEIILSSLQPLGRISVALEHASGMTLAEDIIAEENIPPFDNAGMDGYAIRSGDIEAVPTTLQLAGEIAAGSVPGIALKPRQAVRIMTGAIVPPEADAVIQQEWTQTDGEGNVVILKPVKKGANIRLAGADIPAGRKALADGTLLRPQELGVLASLGRDFVSVYRPARVAILSTGSELVGVSQPLQPGKIRESNGIVLAALAAEVKADVTRLGIVADDRGLLREKLTEGLAADVLITSGGISVGAYDYVMEAMRTLGVEIKFWKVNIKPGMPLMFGVRGKCAVFSLPGNPVSSMVTFLQFVKPALRKLMGSRETAVPFRLRVALGEEIEKKDGKRHFMRGMVAYHDGQLSVCPAGSQVSNVMTSLSRANCLMIIPEEAASLRKGEEVEIELL